MDANHPNTRKAKLMNNYPLDRNAPFSEFELIERIISSPTASDAWVQVALYSELPEGS
jgi:hypothetical protein